MTAEAWAAWVQAVGSIVAIAAGFFTVAWQNSNARKAREQDRADRDQDRADRALVVAFRLSGWLGEVGALIEHAKENIFILEHITKGPPPPRYAQGLKLHVTAVVDPVLPDIHYLTHGTGDVAQLDWHLRRFNRFLDEAVKKTAWEDQQRKDFVEQIRSQVGIMADLYANAERHVGPLIQAAMAKER